MKKRAASADALLQKIRRLPPDKAAQVEDFVEFLSQREDRALSEAAGKVSEQALRRVWNNTADSGYDRL